MFVNQFHVNNIKEQVTRKNKTFMIALLLAFANTTLAYDLLHIIFGISERF